MANEVKFIDNNVQVKNALKGAIEAYLADAGGEIVAVAVRNTPVDQGHLKNSWRYEIDMSENKCTIGSSLENALWNEFGTGEHALNHDGRKGGWYIPDVYKRQLIGMMDKHVVSVHDLVNEHAEGRQVTAEKWREKIGDNINYLLILWAMVEKGLAYGTDAGN